jgi:D-inositol-3-phosphate glycosyltransferase
MNELRLWVDDFARSVGVLMGCNTKPDILHANYWLSGIAGHWLKHELDIPLVMTFHTLDRVKALTFGEPSSERAAEEERIMACSDAVLASCDIEAQQIVDFYGANPARVHIVPLGVEHAFFSPGNKMAARRALGMPTDEALLLFAGRIQDLKGVDLALEAFIEVRRRSGTGHLAIVGGPSGPSGRETLDRVQRRIAEAGVIESVSLVAPQTHQLLSSWFRAADLTLVPSLAESFGLVALESAACGTPVVSSAVGGLLTLIAPGQNGLLLASRDSKDWADAIERILEPAVGAGMAQASAAMARQYTWRHTAEAISDLVHRLQSGALLLCP